MEIYIYKAFFAIIIACIYTRLLQFGIYVEYLMPSYIICSGQ